MCQAPIPLTFANRYDASKNGVAAIDLRGVERLAPASMIEYAGKRLQTRRAEWRLTGLLALACNPTTTPHFPVNLVSIILNQCDGE
ncbi:hypothetical protein RSAG8_13583, partial [Rhizoctonia solani AG-8 WAC10335]